MNDLRYAFRMLRKRPGGNLIVIATLALLIGTFSLGLGVANHSRGSWVPFPDTDRLVRVWRMGEGRPGENFPKEVFLELQKNCRSLESIGGIGGHKSKTVTGFGEPQRYTALRVAADAIKATGLQPVVGRIFSAEEERDAANPPLLISEHAWRELFNGSESAIGSQMMVDGVSHTVVGVMPRGADNNAMFYGMSLWLPGNFESPSSDESWIGIVGRLKSGVTRRQLNAELAALVPAAEAAFNKEHEIDRPAASAAAHPIGKQFGRTDADEVFLIAIVPLLVLLIACFNVANVLLTRMISRRKELAVRSSLGASRGRLTRQLLIESVVLALCGGGVGLLGAVWIAPWSAARSIEAKFSPGAVAAVFGVTILIGLFIGLAPSLRATRGDLNRDLKSGLSADIHRHRLRNFLVAGQVAMATMLCITAALFMRSYLNKKSFDPGFDTARSIELPISPRRDVYDTLPKRRLYASQVLENMRGIPGLDDVSLSTASAVNRHPFPVGIHFEENDNEASPYFRTYNTAISPNYFKIVNLPILRGRGIEDSDKAGTERVAVVNQRFVQRYYPDADPIGRRIKVHIDEASSPWVTIVGVVPDQPNVGSQPDFGPEIFLAFDQTAPRWSSYHFLARTRSDPGRFSEALKEAARQVDASQPMSRTATLDSRLAKIIERDTAPIRAFTGIGVFGLIMALLGIYGVVSHSVAERTHEIGVRVALGADRGDTLRLILGQGMRLVAIGLIAGVLLASATTFAISQMLFGIGVLDPLTYAVVGLAMLSTALLASLIPARHATRVDPITALRYE